MTPEERLHCLESRVQIDQLIARYGFAVDNRELAQLAGCFTADAVVRSLDGMMNATGPAAIMEMFRGRFAVLGPTFHFTHDRIVDFDANDLHSASGIVAAHAEVLRNGETMLAAIRYQDRYREEFGHWRIAKRVLSFMYYTPAAQYLETMKSALRQRAYGDQRPADWPEALASWRNYSGTP
jgi:ketosteroid isomerase-like protein